MQPSLTVFAGETAVASGDRDHATSVIRTLTSAGERRPVLVFDDATGDQVDLPVTAGPLPTSVSPVGATASPRRPGRPRLGVVPREVTLLPRHWAWLNAQPGGASVALRKLVEQGRRADAEADRRRRSREAAYRFMSAIAGNAPGFEEASRALFAGDRARFETETASWPVDVASYAKRLAREAFPGELEEAP